jgi:microcystin-dependent protein
MSEPYLGQVIAVGFNFAPVNWALCQGQLLPISQYTALFQLLGTTYGGDGVSTFGLPDLRGRAALGMGQGSGLQSYVLGQLGGVESVTLTANQFAGHTHALQRGLARRRRRRAP